MRLPLEIVIHILKFTCDGGDPRQTRAVLRNCSLVSKDWSFISQELLYRDVTLTNEIAFAAFETATCSSSPRSRILARAVQRLHCVLDDKQPGGLTQAMFTRAILRCPNLSTLSVAMYGPKAHVRAMGDGRSDSTVAKMTSAFLESTLFELYEACPAITALHFDNWTDDATAPTQLLQTMPFITSLSVGGKSPSLPSSIVGLYPCALQELRLNFQAPPSEEFLGWLLTNSKASLRSLDFQRDPSPLLLDYLIKEHHETLQSLALPSCPSKEGASLISQCCSLRALRLENVWTAPGVRRQLPHSLERLALAVDKDTPLRPVMAQLQ